MAVLCRVRGVGAKKDTGGIHAHFLGKAGSRVAGLRRSSEQVNCAVSEIYRLSEEEEEEEAPGGHKMLLVLQHFGPKFCVRQNLPRGSKRKEHPLDGMGSVLRVRLILPAATSLP